MKKETKGLLTAERPQELMKRAAELAFQKDFPFSPAFNDRSLSSVKWPERAWMHISYTEVVFELRFHHMNKAEGERELERLGLETSKFQERL